MTDTATSKTERPLTPHRARKLRRRKRRRVVESALIRAAVALIPRLPRPVVVALARSLGTLGYLADSRSRRVAMENLAHVMPALDRKASRKIARESVITFALTSLDLFWFYRKSEARLDRYVSVDASVDVIWNTHPVILLAAHFGNWDIQGLVMATRGHPPTSVFQPSGNPVVDEIVQRMRERTGMHTVPNTNVMRPLLRTLKSGGNPALLIDQNTEPSRGGVYVDFFGLGVPNSAAVAVLARKTDTPVIPIYCRRDARGHYHFYTSPAITAQDGDDDISLTQRMASDLEREVRAHPEQWAWSYKRWKFVPDDGEMCDYPSYARRLSDRERGRPERAQRARSSATTTNPE